MKEKIEEKLNMTVCIEKNVIRGKLITNTLNIEHWWNKYTYNKKSGEITETPILGEKLFELFHHKVLFKHYEITVMIGHKEYYICDKTKNWADKTYDGYNEEITRGFWIAYKEGILTGKKEKLSGKQLIKKQENG